MAHRDLNPLYEKAYLMPSLHRCPRQAARIGRIIAAFGEIEFILGLCLAEAIGDLDTALRTIFLLNNDRARIDVAESLLRPICFRTGLGEPFDETITTIRKCHPIRNQYAHCHYGDQKRFGLFFTNLQEAASKKDSFNYFWRHISIPILDQQESYFLYAQHCLQFMETELRYRLGRSVVPPPFPWPQKLAPPPLHSPPTKHVPPWLSEAQKQRHIEIALEVEYGAGLRIRPPKAPKEPKPSRRQRRDATLR
jgi:hypothetical protein